jgi:hypothetical protein
MRPNVGMVRGPRWRKGIIAGEVPSPARVYMRPFRGPILWFNRIEYRKLAKFVEEAARREQA